MSLSIEADETMPIPRPTTLLLSCDHQQDADLFVPRCPTTRIYALGGYVENMAQAMAEGWLERHDPKHGRLFLCPEHSGKKPKVSP